MRDRSIAAGSDKVTAARARVVPPSARAGARTLHGRKSFTLTRQLQGCLCEGWRFRSTAHHQPTEIWWADQRPIREPPAQHKRARVRLRQRGSMLCKRGRLQVPVDPAEEGRARLRRNTGNTSGDVASGPTPGPITQRDPGLAGVSLCVDPPERRIRPGMTERFTNRNGPAETPVEGRPCATASPQFARRARSGLAPPGSKALRA